jgi:hypothetical protein
MVSWTSDLHLSIFRLAVMVSLTSDLHLSIQMHNVSFGALESLIYFLKIYNELLMFLV